MEGPIDKRVEISESFRHKAFYICTNQSHALHKYFYEIIDVIEIALASIQCDLTFCNKTSHAVAKMKHPRPDHRRREILIDGYISFQRIKSLYP